MPPHAELQGRSCSSLGTGSPHAAGPGSYVAALAASRQLRLLPQPHNFALKATLTPPSEALINITQVGLHLIDLNAYITICYIFVAHVFF